MTRKNAANPADAVQPASKPTLLKAEFTEKVKKRAYEIYLSRGGRPGSDVSDWLRAEKEIRTRYNVAK